MALFQSRLSPEVPAGFANRSHAIYPGQRIARLHGSLLKLIGKDGSSERAVYPLRDQENHIIADYFIRAWAELDGPDISMLTDQARQVDVQEAEVLAGTTTRHVTVTEHGELRVEGIDWLSPKIEQILLETAESTAERIKKATEQRAIQQG